MAKTVKDHWDGILSYFDSQLTTGFLEGINSLIQSAKARARGYRNPRNMISIACLYCWQAQIQHCICSTHLKR
jgi:transposase